MQGVIFTLVKSQEYNTLIFGQIFVLDKWVPPGNAMEPQVPTYW